MRVTDHRLPREAVEFLSSKFFGHGPGQAVLGGPVYAVESFRAPFQAQSFSDPVKDREHGVFKSLFGNARLEKRDARNIMLVTWLKKLI